MLHPAGRSFGAQNTLVDRVVAIALDIANFAAAQMNVDAAPTGAHVASCFFYLITNFWRRVDKRFRAHCYFLKLKPVDVILC